MRVRRGTVEFGYKDSYDFTTITEIIQNWLINHKKVIDDKWKSGAVVGVPYKYLCKAEEMLGCEQGVANLLLSEQELSTEGVKEIWDKAHQLRLNDLDTMIKAWETEEYDLDKCKNIFEWREKQKELQEERHKGRMLFIEEVEGLWW